MQPFKSIKKGKERRKEKRRKNKKESKSCVSERREKQSIFMLRRGQPFCPPANIYLSKSIPPLPNYIIVVVRLCASLLYSFLCVGAGIAC